MKAQLTALIVSLTSIGAMADINPDFTGNYLCRTKGFIGKVIGLFPATKVRLSIERFAGDNDHGDAIQMTSRLNRAVFHVITHSFPLNKEVTLTDEIGILRLKSELKDGALFLTRGMTITDSTIERANQILANETGFLEDLKTYRSKPENQNKDKSRNEKRREKQVQALFEANFSQAKEYAEFVRANLGKEIVSQTTISRSGKNILVEGLADILTASGEIGTTTVKMVCALTTEE